MTTQNKTHKQDEKPAATPTTPATSQIIEDMVSKSAQIKHYLVSGCKKIFHITKVILALIFFPFVWFGKESSWFRTFSRIKFGFAMNEEEKYFVNSWPIFLSLFGGILGLILGIIGAMFNTQEFIQRLNEVLKNFDWLFWLLGEIFKLLLGFLGFCGGLLITLDDFLATNVFFTRNIFIPFTVVSFLEVFAFIIILVVIESKFFQIMIKKVKQAITLVIALIIAVIVDLPEALWHFLIFRVGNFIMGGSYVELLDSKFYKKVMIATFFFSFVVFFGGLLVFFGHPELVLFKDIMTSIIYLITVLFIAGVVAGFAITYIYVKFLLLVSPRRYLIKIK